MKWVCLLTLLLVAIHKRRPHKYSYLFQELTVDAITLTYLRNKMLGDFYWVLITVFKGT